MAGMGKVRPVGQIRPAEASCLASGVVFVHLIAMFDVKILLSNIVYLELWPKGPKKVQIWPVGKKQLPAHPYPRQ